MAEEEGQEVIFTENTAPDREIWDEKGGLIKKGAAEIAERDQDHIPEVKVLTTLGMFAVPVEAETTIGEIRNKVQQNWPEYSLDQIELVCKDKDAWGPLFNKTSRPRDDDETVESLWSDWDIPRQGSYQAGMGSISIARNCLLNRVMGAGGVPESKHKACLRNLCQLISVKAPSENGRETLLESGC